MLIVESKSASVTDLNFSVALILPEVLSKSIVNTITRAYMSIQYRQFYTILASCIHKKGLQILLCNPFEYDYNFYELCDINL